MTNIKKTIIEIHFTCVSKPVLSNNFTNIVDRYSVKLYKNIA